MTRSFIVLALLALAAATPAAAQNTCNLVSQRGNWTSVGDPASRVVSAQGPLLVRCSNGEELRADSAVIYAAQNEVQLFRQVDYQDPGRSLTSDNATYNSQTGRLYATGNVVFTDKQKGSTLRGPELEYFKAMPGRPEAQSTATQRPHVTVVPKNSSGTGTRRNPMEIDADRVTSVGDRYMTATGNVVINDNGTRSTAEEAYYDQVADHVELRRQAKVHNDKYDLSGDLVTSDLQNGSVSRVVAQNNARLVSERLTVTGPLLRMFFERDLLQRMTSGQVPGTTTPGRSVALSKGFRMEADSIEAILPEQRLRQVNAVGKARGESWDTIPVRRVVADSGGVAVAAPQRPMTEPPTGVGEKDVLTADTIIAFFRTDSVRPDTARGRNPRGDSVRLAGRPARPDSARGDTTKTEIERLLAIGDAHSLYRVRNDSTRARQPQPPQQTGLNYLIGDRIDLTFKAGEVDVAHVRGLKQGVYLDPDTRTAQNDTAAARRNGQTGAQPGAARPGQGATPSRPATTTTTAPRGAVRAPPNTPPANPPATPPAAPSPLRAIPAAAPATPAGEVRP